MKIASIENLELLFSSLKNEYLCILGSSNPLADLFQKNLKKSQVRILQSNTKSQKLLTNSEKSLIQTSNINKVLKKEKIDMFLPALHSSTFLENWAKSNKQKLLVTDFTMQKKLENKIFFHTLLVENQLPVPKGKIIKSTKELLALKALPQVIQIPLSEGSQGTFIIKTTHELKELSKNTKLKFPLLARTYIANAFPLGVSVVVGKNSCMFSALRLQVYLLNEENKHEFFGIQWVKTSQFSKATINTLNQYLKKLADLLQKQNFKGVANVDLLIKGPEIFFIECNPRLAGSSPQMTYKKELLHGYDFVEEFTKSILGQELSTNKNWIPNTNFEGCTIDLDYAKKHLINKKMIKAMPCGIYKVKNKNLTLISQSIKNYNLQNDILIAHTLEKTKKITAKQYLGFCFYQKPFIKITKSNYQVSKKGLELLKLVKANLSNQC